MPVWQLPKWAESNFTLAVIIFHIIQHSHLHLFWIPSGEDVLLPGRHCNEYERWLPLNWFPLRLFLRDMTNFYFIKPLSRITFTLTVPIAFCLKLMWFDWCHSPSKYLTFRYRTTKFRLENVLKDVRKTLLGDQYVSNFRGLNYSFIYSSIKELFKVNGKFLYIQYLSIAIFNWTMVERDSACTSNWLKFCNII